MKRGTPLPTPTSCASQLQITSDAPTLRRYHHMRRKCSLSTNEPRGLNVILVISHFLLGYKLSQSINRHFVYKNTKRVVQQVVPRLQCS